jgi:hypothetical protein
MNSPTPVTTLSQPPCPNQAIEELPTGLEQIVLGKTTEEDVVKQLGQPQQRSRIDGLLQLWYDSPGGWITLKDDVVVEKSAYAGNSSRPLREIIAHYGPPEQVILRITKSPQGRSTTFLLYPCQNLEFELPAELYSFTPDLRVVDGSKLMPGYFEEFLHRQGLDGSYKLGEIKTITWPGFSATPVPSK